MAAPSSLTLRLTLLFSSVATLVLLSFGWMIENSIAHHFEAGDAKELKLIASAVKAPLQSLQSTQNLSLLRQRFNDILIGHHHPLLLVLQNRKKLLFSSPELRPYLSELSQLHEQGRPRITHWEMAGKHYRILAETLQINQIPFTLIIAISIDFHQKFLDNFRTILWLVVLGSIAVMSLMSWIAVHYGLRPLHQIIQQLGHIRSHELNTRLDPATVPKELAELILSFNALLARLDESFERLSHFSDDIAHELRTPVTNLITQTQVALSRARSKEAYQEVLYSNMEEFERLSLMIADMLFLAKTDNNTDPIEMEHVNMNYELHNLFDYYEAWADENAVTLHIEGQLTLQCNRLMIRRALSNLLANAIRHTPMGKQVTVILHSTSQDANIIVQNPGEPILSTHIPKLFDRFYRADPSRQRTREGAGLGLAITKSIIEAHGGHIHVTSDDRYTRFYIKLPKQHDA